MVFIKKVRISREVWFRGGGRAGWGGSGEGGRETNGKLPHEFSNNTVIYVAAEICIVL